MQSPRGLTHALRLSCRRPTAPPSALLPRKPDRRAGGWFVAHKSCRSPDGIHAAARQSDRCLMQLYASEVALGLIRRFSRDYMPPSPVASPSSRGSTKRDFPLSCRRATRALGFSRRYQEKGFNYTGCNKKIWRNILWL